MAGTILILNKANAACIDQITLDVFDNPVNSKHLADFLDDPRHIMVVALEDGLVVGMASGAEYFHRQTATALDQRSRCLTCLSATWYRRPMGALVEAAGE
jgi:hypothetical protein